jgi:Xaa-Pro aminopeptidase
MSNRIDRLRDVFTSLGADAAIVTHSANRRYFSGFPADDLAPDESAGVLLVSLDNAKLFTGPSNLPWAAASALGPVVAQQWERPWPAFVGRQLRELGVRRAAFEDNSLTVADHSAIVAAASGVELVPSGNAFHALRAVKDAGELERIAAAARLTDEALAAATEGLRPGISERELAWRIESAMHSIGGNGPAFPTIVASGPNSAHPHHLTSERTIAEGEPIVIDVGAGVDGYCADLTRTLVIGEPTPTFTDRYNSVLAAQQAALSGTKAGMTGPEADSLARDVLVALGFGEQFVHWIGHGVGLLVHEGPSFGPGSEDVLQPGHVITIEPGIYFEGWGGIRIEDLCVVTADGLDVLSHAPK